MAKRNYKIHANIGLSRRHARRFTTVLDTGAGPSFIRKDVLPEAAWDRIQQGARGNAIRDANNHPVVVSGFVDLFVDRAGRSTLVRFYVVERLATSFILR